MNKRVLRRLLETFFRRWWLYLLPVALFGAFGVLKGLDAGSGYQSVGTVDVSQDTLLSQLTSIRGDTFGYQTPAASTAKTVNSLLSTDQFIESVGQQAGVTAALKSGQLTALELRSALSVAPDGDTLVRFSATTNNPELSARLANGAIQSYIQYVVDNNVSESQAAEAFFEQQLPTYSKALSEAQAALADYAANHPGGPQEQRPLDEQIAIQQLTAAVTQAQTQYTTAEQKSEEARLALEQAKSDVSQRLRLIDQPQMPAGPAPRLKHAVFTLVIFLCVGAMITGAAVVLGTVLDRSLRTAEDVEQLLGLPVLTVVPDIRSKARSRRARRKAQAAAEQTPRETTAAERGERPPATTAGTRASRVRAPALTTATQTHREGGNGADGDRAREPRRVNDPVTRAVRTGQVT